MTAYTVTGSTAAYSVSDGTLTQQVGDIVSLTEWLVAHLQYTPTGGDTVTWSAGITRYEFPNVYQVAYSPGEFDVWLNGQSFYEAHDDDPNKALAVALGHLLPCLYYGDSFALGMEE